MNRIRVVSSINVYEVDGVEVPRDLPQIDVSAHWNRDTLVILTIDGKRHTVVASDLRAAVQNATNAH